MDGKLKYMILNPEKKRLYAVEFYDEQTADEWLRTRRTTEEIYIRMDSNDEAVKRRKLPIDYKVL